MDLVQPWSAGARAALEAVRTGLLASPITAVRYYCVGVEPPFVDLDRPDAHEADTVELDLASGATVGLSWEQRMLDEGLSVGIGDPPARESSLEVVDASGAPVWQRLLGTRAVEVRVAWQESEPGGGSGRMLWSVACRMEGGGTFAVALGELTDLGTGGPTYLPDSLVVLFGEEGARAYGNLASDTSAWGEAI